MKTDILTTIQTTRRAFLKYATASLLSPTLLGMVATPISGRAYAQSKDAFSEEALAIAANYGKPTGKFGKLGDPVTLTIGYQPYCTPYWTSVVNKQAKIWQKYLPKGSQVVWFRALSGPLINNNMYTGKNQFGYMAETPGLVAGEMVKCNLVSITGYDLGEVGSIAVALPLLETGKVNTAQDLSKRPVGTPFGSFSHRHILTWAAQNKVELDLINRSVEHQMTALRNQSIWAGALWEPYPTWLEQRGIAKRWVTGQDLPCTCHHYFPEASAHNFRVVGATLAIQDWLRERPDIIIAYLQAEEECREMLTRDPELAAYHIWTDISEIPPMIIRTTLDMMVWDGRITKAVTQHLQGCARMWREQKLLKTELSENPDQFVTGWINDQFWQLANRELTTQGRWTSTQLPGFPKETRPDQLQRHHWKTYQELKLKIKPWQPIKL